MGKNKSPLFETWGVDHKEQRGEKPNYGLHYMCVNILTRYHIQERACSFFFAEIM